MVKYFVSALLLLAIIIGGGWWLMNRNMGGTPANTLAVLMRSLACVVPMARLLLRVSTVASVAQPAS